MKINRNWQNQLFNQTKLQAIKSKINSNFLISILNKIVYKIRNKRKNYNMLFKNSGKEVDMRATNLMIKDMEKVNSTI